MPRDNFTQFNDKTVLIIGAGPAGLVSAAWAKRNGLQPYILEQSNVIGGQWSPLGSIWQNMQTNLSKHSCMFSDLLWPEETAMFPNRQDVYAYLAKYAQMFDLQKNILCNVKIKAIRRVADQWVLDAAYNGLPTPTSGVDYQYACKNVIIATGFFSTAYIPKIADQDKFESAQKRVMHSSEFSALEALTNNIRYSSEYTLAGKKVVIVGSGFSATELAEVVVAKGARSVTHVFERPHWNIGHEIGGLPIDWQFYGRDKRNTEIGIEDKFKILNPANNVAANRSLAKLCPTQTKDANDPLYIDRESTGPAYVSITHEYPKLVETAAIKPMRGRIARYNENGLVLEDGRTVDADVVIFCTGFKSKPILPATEYDANDRLVPELLSKCMFDPNQPNLIRIGNFRGPFFAEMELQARLATGILAGNIPPISPEQMHVDIEEERKIRALNPRPQFPHADYVGYCDHLASLIGCLPNMRQLQIQDPELHRQLWHGPHLPTNYRLFGPYAEPQLFKRQFAQVSKKIAAVIPSHPCLPPPSMFWKYRGELAVFAEAAALFAVQRLTRKPGF
jgi:dimethylaniline monooxygenase (N-oxide forming)